MTAQPLTPNFRRLVDMADQELVLKPLVELYLLEARFPDVFSVTFHKAGIARKPDGWFHPSTHPLWHARQLFYYLSEPDKMEVEQLSYESRMAVTMGTAVHGFIEMCLRDAGYMLPLAGICPCCEKPHGTGAGECDEYGVADKRVGVRGHMDGVIKVPLAGRRWDADQPGLFEFKTMNPRKGYGVADNDVEWFKEKCPDYYGQVQDYMEASGLRQCLVLIALLGFPWKLIEIQVPYDFAYIHGLRQKYSLVRDHEKMGTPPDPCCAPLSKESKSCPARYVCPIGRLGR